MGTCRICGKQTIGDYQYCMQCNPQMSNRSKQSPDGRRRNPSGGNNPAQGLGGDYLKNGYFHFVNGKPYLREEIFTTEAELVARVLSTKGMTSASLRRFYQKVMGINQRFKDTGDFEEAKPCLFSLYPNAADAVTRNNNVPEEFRQFINKNVKLATKDAYHFKGFVEHFQSVLAYFKETGGKK